MKIRSSVVRVGCWAILATGMTQAGDLYVQQSVGNDANPGHAWGTGYALATIQRALVLAQGQAGADTIHVAAGTYHEHLQVGSDVSLLGSYPASGSGPRNRDTSPSIIDAAGIVDASGRRMSAIDIHNASQTTLDLFVVINGRNEVDGNGIGGGASIIYSTGPVTLSNNLFENNWASWGGGIGIMTHSAEPVPVITLTGNLIRNNDSGHGGGVSVYDAAAVLDNNTLTANTTNEQGGGLVAGEASLTLTRNTISANHASSGGGVAWSGCRALSASGNTIVSNQATTDGGGIFHQSCAGHLTNNSIQRNSAGNWGGGVCLYTAHPETFANNLITDNTAVANGGGVSLYDGATAVIVNNTLTNNQANGLGGGLYAHYGTSATVRNSILWANQSTQITNNGTVQITYSDIAGGWNGVGNLSQDPLFADPAAGDYHLRSLGGRYQPATLTWVVDKQHSPAIDAGNPRDAFANETQPNDARINLGAFGNTVQASRSDIGLKLPDRGDWRAILGR
ncbi:right-handed parallel beta-helix repeat-containing protein [uncultured Lamprocystis sp.]|jgi:parallel beta-helix repeat protein|uniref:right-handed parallel beta-helix repeat-containing protein n=1 Tax=uncultured Lamprocystis sp. TaxID=543132 RepID=UPI0025F41C19|nr:right-handed parallel beta-helix repeat-containing protein [uncultured Lamprocystis sp.]